MAIKLFIKGKPVTPPKDIIGAKILMAYGDGSSQPSIESDRFTVSLDAANEVFNHIESDKIFEELESSIEFDGLTVLDGFIDTSEELEYVNVDFGQGNEQPNEAIVKFKKNSSKQYFQEKIKGVTYSSLYKEGIITDRDFTTIKTTVQKRFDFIEFATLLITIYLLKKQIQDAIKDIQNTIIEVKAIISAGQTGFVGAATLAILKGIVQTAYAVALLALLSNLVVQLIYIIQPPTVKNKGIKFKTLLEKACEKFGYSLQTNIEELDIYNYLPSKSFSNSKGIFQKIAGYFLPLVKPNKIGIPSTSDYGYLVSEMFELCEKQFNTRIDVIDGVVMMYNKADKIWNSKSEFKPSIKIKLGNKQFNTSDLPQTKLFSYATDISDPWTIENYTGTSYEVKTQLKNGKLGTIKGIERVDIPLCLPNSKTETSPIEKIIEVLAEISDAVNRALGQKTNLASQVRDSFTNTLKVATNQFNVAKIVPIVNGVVPRNHRTLLSAKTTYHKFHYSDSFVLGDKLGQKVIYNNIEMPFNNDNLLQTQNNGTFTLPDGRDAKFIENSYIIGEDKADVSIEVSEIYVNNLEEIYYEP